VPKRWDIAPKVPLEASLAFPELHPVILQLLWNRGVTTQEAIDVFLGPDWARDTHDPFLFSRMQDAVARVFASLERGEVITVHGDYDADGVCGSAVLMSTLRDICRALKFDEGKLTVYLPHREKEGYGLSKATVEHLHIHEKTNLIITVDCGISNGDAIARAKELGIDTIVCDHHTMPDVLPTDAILLHPLVPGEPYPNKHLCGTGVAYKLASALIHEARKRGTAMPEGYEKWLLDLVAIATVTDVMPLLGENRVLETYGLLVLNKTRRAGLRKLYEVAGIVPGKIETWTIGFQIGPRLNAAGRMHHASGAFHLLMAEDDAQAEKLAEELNAANVARQRASDEMYRAAKEQIGEPGDRALLVAVSDGWPAGLVGLVAGKLSSEFGRPVIVAGRDADTFVGSGRSVPEFDITSALRAAADHLDRFGGHPQACGFSTTGEERFRLAIERMCACAADALRGVSLAPTVQIDADIALEDVSWELYESVIRLAPFGEGNREPVFALQGVTVLAAETVGADGKHLRLLVRSPKAGATKKLIGFGIGSLVHDVRPGAIIDVAVQLGVNEWNGNRELQLKVVDLKVTE
jgi:single-stranded-DNA-specific exonuclease